MARGIDGKKIFADNEDREKFLACLGSVLLRQNCRCYSWALLPNHYHLLLRPSDDGLGILMRRLNTSYARYYNRKHRRRGYLFQDRYKSVATQELFYFKDLIRYIHLNPVRWGLVRTIKGLDAFPWCSHRDVVGPSRFPWLHKKETLRRFGSSTDAALKEYAAYLGRDDDAHNAIERKMHSTTSIEKPNPIYERADERVWGDRDFVCRALKMDGTRKSNRIFLKNRGVTTESIVKTVSAHFGVSPAVIQLPGRKSDRSRARDVAAYLARCRLGESLTEIGKHFGVTASAVSYMVVRGAKLAYQIDFNSLI